MVGSGHNAKIWMEWMLPARVALALALSSAAAIAQQAPPTLSASAQGNGAKSAPATNPSAEVTLDRVVAIVNGDLILESDVDEEQRFAAFQPFSEASPMSRAALINRLINRTLILQQMALQPEPPISDADVDAELNTLRKSVPSCAAYHCDTNPGWEKFVTDHGFTMQELRDRWRLRMQVLRFIEQRFRSGIFDTITEAQVDDYYKKTMLPVYQKEKMTPPPESSVADRIQEILLQQQVNKLLDDWLTSLRAEGSVRILKPGEEAP
jgi:peptidyl-prolyl cis-trans isomerase SurA